MRGVEEGGWGWGATIWDYDNDGKSDIVRAKGIHLLDWGSFS